MPLISSHKLSLEHPLLNDLLDSTMLVWHVVDRGLKDRNISVDTCDPIESEFFENDGSIIDAINDVSARNYDNSFENNFADASSCLGSYSDDNLSTRYNSPHYDDTLTSINMEDPSLSLCSELDVAQVLTSPELIRTPKDCSVDFYDDDYCGLNSISIAPDTSNHVLREGYISSTETEDAGVEIDKNVELYDGLSLEELKESCDLKKFKSVSDLGGGSGLYSNESKQSLLRSLLKQQDELRSDCISVTDTERVYSSLNIELNNHSAVSNDLITSKLGLDYDTNQSIWPETDYFNSFEDETLVLDEVESELKLKDHSYFNEEDDDVDSFKFDNLQIDKTVDIQDLLSNMILPSPLVVPDTIMNSIKSPRRPLTQNQLSFYISCDRARFLRFSDSHLIRSGYSPYQLYSNQLFSGFGLSKPRFLHRSHPSDPSDSFHLTPPTESDLVTHLETLMAAPCLLVISLGHIKLDLTRPSSEQNHIYGATHQELIVLLPLPLPITTDVME